MGRMGKVGLALIALGVVCKGWAVAFGWAWDEPEEAPGYPLGYPLP